MHRQARHADCRTSAAFVCAEADCWRPAFTSLAVKTPKTRDNRGPRAICRAGVSFALVMGNDRFDGNLHRAVAVSRAASAHDHARPAPALQADGDGFWLGDLHAARQHRHLLGDLHARRVARRRHALSGVRLLRPRRLELLRVGAPLLGGVADRQPESRRASCISRARSSRSRRCSCRSSTSRSPRSRWPRC